MIAFLTSRLGIGLIGIVGVVLMYVGWSVQVANLRSDISAEQQRTREAQFQFDSYKLQVEQAIAAQERIRANENLAALEQQRTMEAEINRLRGVVQVAERRRVEASNQLLRALQNAPQADTSLLAGAVLSYLDGVRALQRSPSTGGPAPPGN